MERRIDEGERGEGGTDATMGMEMEEEEEEGERDHTLRVCGEDFFFSSVLSRNPWESWPLTATYAMIPASWRLIWDANIYKDTALYGGAGSFSPTRTLFLIPWWMVAVE